MEKKYKLCALNLGSTSTKVAVFENETMLFSANVAHEASRLKEFKEIADQVPYRKETILAELAKKNISLEGTDAFIGSGGSLVSVQGGTYITNDLLLHHARIGYTIKHPAAIGSLLADEFAHDFGAKAFVVNPPDVDELQDVARITGWKDVYRESRVHVLNQKEVGQRYAKELGKRYEDANLVIAHIGGGLSVTAHCKGKMIDSSDAVQGEGPMAPTRCGTLPVMSVIKACYSGQYTERELQDRVRKNGGLVDLLGTSDTREVCERIKNGDEYAKLVYDAFIYQIGKHIGAYATVMHGKVDGIALTGGCVYDNYLVEKITEMVSFIAPVKAYPGELEMEAMANGALRVLTGQEEAKVYNGVPVWPGFAVAAGASK
ncbi:MAG TPA: butyrate kinase [Terriglobales bacterium]